MVLAELGQKVFDNVLDEMMLTHATKGGKVIYLLYLSKIDS